MIIFLTQKLAEDYTLNKKKRVSCLEFYRRLSWEIIGNREYWLEAQNYCRYDPLLKNDALRELVP